MCKPILHIRTNESHNLGRQQKRVPQLQADGSTYYTPGLNCTWLLAAEDGRLQRYSFKVNRRRMGPGATLQIYDASKTGALNALEIAEFTGYGAATRDVVIETVAVGITFTANRSAEPALGPEVVYQILPKGSDNSRSTAIGYIVAASVVILLAHVILALLAWKGWKRVENGLQQADRETARSAQWLLYVMDPLMDPLLWLLSLACEQGLDAMHQSHNRNWQLCTSKLVSAEFTAHDVHVFVGSVFEKLPSGEHKELLQRQLSA